MAKIISGSPVFTVLLPMKGRPELALDALESVLSQTFKDFEVIVSNNGADSDILNKIAHLIDDPRVIYTEQSSVLPMPAHWEKISLLASGQYITVLTDRSVFTKTALEHIYRIHQSGDKRKIVSWSWHLFHNDLRILQPFAKDVVDVIELDSEALALQSINLNAKYPVALPRGLNSSVSIELIDEIRNAYGRAFSPITPDFSFAYDCLLRCKKVTYIDRALMVSQGLGISNGGLAYLTDAANYVNSLGIVSPIKFSPIKELFVENIIAEDLFAACARSGRYGLLDKIDRVSLYAKCLNEMTAKIAAGELPKKRLDDLKLGLDNALLTEPEEVVLKVEALKKDMKNSIKRLTNSFKRRLSGLENVIQPLRLRLAGGRKYRSVLHAAGFKN